MEKLNIAELLKDCPKSMELDCILFKDTPIYFHEVTTDTNYPIEIKVEHPCKELETFFLNKYGAIYDRPTAKCVIFPKGKTTWEGFQRPFKDGEIVACDNPYINSSEIFIFKDKKGCNILSNCYLMLAGDELNIEERAYYVTRLATEEEKAKLFDAIKANGYKWNAETKTLEKLIEPKFKVGDQIVRKNSISNSFIVNSVSSEYYGLALPDRTGVGVLNVSERDDWELVHPIHKFKAGDKIVKKDNPTECWYVQGVNTNCNSDYFYYIVAKSKIANLYFKDQDEWELAPVPKFKVGDIVKSKWGKLFDYKIIKITDTHYTLESIPSANTYDIFICEDENWKLVPNKFDISTLKAYDKVLVRDTNEQVWVADLFSHVLDRPLGGYTFACVGHYPNQCIPYLGNEHLLGTNNDCDEYFKN